MNSEPNYYLKKKNANTGKCLVFLQFKYHGNTLRFSFKLTVDPNEWNPKKQRLKSTSAITESGKFYINDLLDNLSSFLKQAYLSELTNGIPSTQLLKERLTNYLFYNLNEQEKKKNEPTLMELIERFESGEISYMGKQKSPKTLQTYRSARLHLQQFSKAERYPITYESITLDLFYRLTAYLRKRGLAHNTIAKTVTMVKVFMNHANEMGFTTNMIFKHRLFSMPEKETDAVYLTQQELTMLYHFDLGYNKRLEKVRDLFLVGCMTGLRFSDFSTIKKENFVTIDDELYIKIMTTKTKELVIIPINPMIIEIMKRYDENPNNLPTGISNQKFNKYIKEICEIAGLTETGRLSTNMEAKLYTLISSHSCRRSFCSNLYLAGVDARTIRMISGHRSEKSFNKYIKVSRMQSAQILQGHMKSNASKYMLAAV